MAGGGKTDGVAGSGATPGKPVTDVSPEARRRVSWVCG